MPTTPFDPNAAAQPGSGVFSLPHEPDRAGVVLLPVPWEVTTSYRTGTADGPAAILEASRQIDLYDVETGRPYLAGIAMLDEPADVRAWNDEGRPLAEQVIAAGGATPGDAALGRALDRVNQLGAQLNDRVRAETDRALDDGRLIGIVGGDHSVPLGAIQALARRHPGLGILHIDAHADLRDAYEGFTWSHASIMFNVLRHAPEVARIVQVGLRDVCEAEADLIRDTGDRLVAHFDADLAARACAGESWAIQCERIVADLPREVYVSFDIDGLDPTLCPHTGTPVPGGLQYAQALFLLGAVARGGRRIVGFDLCEVAPGPAGDEWDANVAMRILYKLIGWALRSQGRAT
jgi:agmatinase